MKWEISEFKCPKCGGECEKGYETETHDGHTGLYGKAERCKKGCFYLDFEKDGIG